MKKENFRDTRVVNIKTSALLGLFLYIVATLIFDTILGWIDKSSGYPYIFGLIEFVLISVGILFYSWTIFKNASQETPGRFCKYLLIQLIPLIVMTLLTIIFTYKGTDGSFSSNWNMTSWIIAPTMFFYLPFGFLFEIIKVIPLTLFMPMCILLIAGLEYCGFLLGTGKRKYLRQREQVVKEKLAEKKVQQEQMAHDAAIRMEEQKQEEATAPETQKQAPVEEKPIQERKAEHRHYVLDDIEGQSIIKTEAMATITEEMIEEAVRNQAIKDREQKIMEARAKRAAQINISEQKEKREIKQDLSKELEMLKRRLNKRD